MSEKKPYNNKLSLERMMKKLTNEEKITYMRLALNMQHIGVDDRMADQIVETYETILRIGHDFTIKDAVKIEKYIQNKYNNLDESKK